MNMLLFSDIGVYEAFKHLSKGFIYLWSKKNIQFRVNLN